MIKECCNNERIIIKGDVHIGLYCKNCGKWLKWISKKEYPILKKIYEEV